MSLQFFTASCTDDTSASLFGLCDDKTNQRAYIATETQSNWIAIVENPNQHEVKFIGIDNCVPIFRANGEIESRCDGLLLYNDNLIFVELKERDIPPAKWVKKGYEQLKTTILLFKQENDLSKYKSLKAYLVNSMRPNVPITQINKIQQFYTETSILLYIQQLIRLD